MLKIYHYFQHVKKIHQKILYFLLAIFKTMVYITQAPAGVMELVDVVDSKSTAGDSVPVRVRSPAPYRVFITDLTVVDTRFLFVLMYEQANRLLIFYALLVTYSTATPFRVSAV